MPLHLKLLCDGDMPDFVPRVLKGLLARWHDTYRMTDTLEVGTPENIKRSETRATLTTGLTRIERIRNPDVFFLEATHGIELGGIEVTSHSPDGSNIEKRYPFLWAAPGSATNAFVATPYLKRRPSGQTNRLPLRHIHRNKQFLNDWSPDAEPTTILRHFLPVRELHLGDLQHIPPAIAHHLLTWHDLGALFADLLAARVAASRDQQIARQNLKTWKQRLTQLADACEGHADHRAEASSLLRLGTRWIQVYNSRPDSGHWERGEGQFDSIDGRLMFTLDEIEYLPTQQRPAALEFWLPQMVSSHPWIKEQLARGHGSKRLRNILVELKSVCTTRFADDLTDDDWQLLAVNSRLLLERKDWEPLTYHIASLTQGRTPEAIADAGISNAPAALRQAIAALLSDSALHYCAIRGYTAHWDSELRQQLAQLPTGSTVLLPRLPKNLVARVRLPTRVRVIAAEECTKEHLCMLRQLHRHVF